MEEAEPEMSAKEIRAIRKPPEVEVIAPAQQIDDQIPGQDSIEQHPEYMPGKMTIETATGQNRPPENEIPITPELQIEGFFEALNKGDKERVLTCDINATTYLLEVRYQDVRIRNGKFNYQANSTGIMFNPGSYMECAFTWNELAHELIKRFGKKRKPVKMVSIDAPEKKDNKMPGPAKCITGKSGSGKCGAAAYCDTEYKCCAQCPDDCNGKAVFEDLLTAKQVTEKLGIARDNVCQAAANFALVDKKYRIIPEDIKLSRNLDITLLLEWDRVRKKILQTAGGKNES